MSFYELNTIQLWTALSSNQITSPYLGAVCAADQLPKNPIQFPKLFVVNTQTSEKPGEHWISFFLPENKIVEFFDPLGKTPQHYNNSFENFLLYQSVNYLISTCPVQSPDSSACGYFSLFYLALRCNGSSMEQVLSCLDLNKLEENTNVVVNFVNQFYS